MSQDIIRKAYMKYRPALVVVNSRLLLHVSPTCNVLRHTYIVFPDDLAKGKRFSWCYSSCNYCSSCGSCSCVVVVAL